MLLARVVLQLHWGFWSRIPIVSARQDTLSIPPPSTLLGALAAGLARGFEALCGIRPHEVLRIGSGGAGQLDTFTALLVRNRAVHEVYMRILDGYGVSWIDPGRVFNAPYIDAENLSNPRFWWGLRYLGKVYAPGMVLEAAYLVDNGGLKSLSALFGCDAPPEELLYASLASITRLGPVEGIASPIGIDVEEVGEPREVDVRDIDSPCPYHRAGRQRARQGYVIMFFDEWRNPGYWGYSPRARFTKIQYVVPLPPNLLDKGVLAPFTPCNLVYTRHVHGYLMRGLYGGERYALYPA